MRKLKNIQRDNGQKQISIVSDSKNIKPIG